LKFVKRAAFIAVFVAAAAVWFLAMTGLQWLVLFPLFGVVWSQWWGWVISFTGFFWITMWTMERWYRWTREGKL
jgi:hypothetical protein